MIDRLEMALETKMMVARYLATKERDGIEELLNISS